MQASRRRPRVPATRLPGWLLGLLMAGAAVAQPAFQHTLSEHYGVGDNYMRVGLRGALHLRDASANGLAMVELSGLAWDDDEERLYALSDNGLLFHLRPRIVAGLLRDVELLRGVPLLDGDGARLRGDAADAEGLEIRGQNNGIRGDTELLITFERLPRVVVYNPSGHELDRVALPPALVELYRGGNKGFEAVSLVPGVGLVIAPEWPRPDSTSPTTLFHAPDGRSWRFFRYPAPSSAVVAIEAMPDGSLLTLERSFVSVLQPLQIVLRRTAPLAPGGGELPVSVELAVFNSFSGWQIDNFEGLARHGDSHVFLVSDDNENWPQKTLLLYLELLDAPASLAPVAPQR